MKSFALAVLLIFTFITTAISQTPDSLKLAPKHSDTLGLNHTDSIRQVDFVDYLVKLFKIKNSTERRDNRKVRFSLFPTESNVAGGKTVFTSFNVAFLLGDKANTNISTIYFVPYISFGHQFGFQLQPNIWLSRNSWNFTGEYFIMNYPQNTWGLGGNSKEENITLIDYDAVRVHQNALKGILPHLAIGLGYAYDQHYNIVVEPSDYSDTIKNYFPKDKDNTISSGITLPLIYDSRHNSINPEQGFLLNVTYSFYDPKIGSDERWTSLFADVRKYFRIFANHHNILAFRSYYWSVLSGNAPYLDLPANRWEPTTGSASRGITQNRYRSNAITYFETEYRFGITDNGLFGGVVFANIASASEYNTQNFLYWHPAAGVGVRLKFNKYSMTNITFDYGFSKGFQTVYVNIGEAF